MRIAKRTSFSVTVTRLTWVAHKTQSSNTSTMQSSTACCRALIAHGSRRSSVLRSETTSRSWCWKGSLPISKFDVRGYRWNSRRAWVQGMFCRISGGMTAAPRVPAPLAVS